MKKTRRIETFFEAFRVIIAVLLAYAISLVILSLISKDPLHAIYQFIVGPFERLSRIGDMISLAVPLIFTGLAMCFMYAVNKFNLVAEGIFIFSGCMITWVGLGLADAGLPSVVMIAILVVAGALCGGLAAAVPALLDAKFKANVVVVSLMLNYILFYFTQYMIKYVIKDPASAITASMKLPQSALLGKLVPDTTVHWGLIIALACVVLVVVLFYKTPFGYTMRTVGCNSNFAKYAGMSVVSTVVLTQIVGGMFAGMGGAVEIMGRYTKFQWTNMTGHGFDGLMVAVLARRNPALVPVGALLLAYIRTGADIVNRSTDIPPEFVAIIQGIIIFLVAAEMFLSEFKRRMIFKSAKEELKKEEGKA